MTVFRTTNTDNTTSYIYIQGARSADTMNDISGVIFTNYDDDDHIKYHMASITLKDHYGNTLGKLNNVTLYWCNLSVIKSQHLTIDFV